jgi:hypothetical protein
MKRGLIIVLVLSLLVGMMSLSSFAAVGNYQNGGMMYGNNSNYNGGMMNGSFSGRGNMMNGNFSGRGGMMGYGNANANANVNGFNPACINNPSNTDGTNAGVLSENAITLDAAYDIGKSYLEKELSSEYTLDTEGIAAGDYYTFFIEAADKTVGRLSVNALTSEVWLHNCRGLLQ